MFKAQVPDLFEAPPKLFNFSSNNLPTDQFRQNGPRVTPEITSLMEMQRYEEITNLWQVGDTLLSVSRAGSPDTPMRQREQRLRLWHNPCGAGVPKLLSEFPIADSAEASIIRTRRGFDLVSGERQTGASYAVYGVSARIVSCFVPEKL